MSTDFEKGLRKTIDLSVKSKELTADILKSAMHTTLGIMAGAATTILGIGAVR